MLERLTKTGRRNSALGELRDAMATAPLLFTAEASDAYDDLNGKLHLEPSPPTERRFAIRDGTSTPLSHLSQPLLLVEGVAFFCHYVRRLSFRRNDERLSDAIDPIISASVALVGDMLVGIAGSGEPDPRSVALEHVNVREFEYAAARTMLGDDPADESTVLGMAGVMISKALDRPQWAYLPVIVRTALLKQMTATDWPGIVKRIEANLAS